MQREIKFRAWDKRKNIMRDVECVGSVFSRSEVYDTSNGRECVMNDHIELMQYTGLKDKNGKEIYEGDILQDIRHDKYNWLVGFNEGSFVGYQSNCRTWDVRLRILTNTKAVQIIGNIYENPELLQEVDT